MMSTLDRIVAGEGKFETVALKDGRKYTYKMLHGLIFCADGTEISVQASYTHHCIPCNDEGPYSHLEVGYPNADPPESWAEYAEYEYPSSIYARVPVALVREFIEAHGGDRADSRQKGR
jgi:hypothetical protein